MYTLRPNTPNVSISGFGPIHDLPEKEILRLAEEHPARHVKYFMEKKKPDQKAPLPSKAPAKGNKGNKGKTEAAK